MVRCSSNLGLKRKIVVFLFICLLSSFLMFYANVNWLLQWRDHVQSVSTNFIGFKEKIYYDLTSLRLTSPENANTNQLYSVPTKSEEVVTRNVETAEGNIKDYQLRLLSCLDADGYTTEHKLSTKDLLVGHFLPNYRNPCWKETIETVPNSNLGMFLKEVPQDLKDYNRELAKKLNRHESVERLRCFPHVFLAGMPKCGTTDLHRNLVMHPDITAGLIKEPQWFNRRSVGLNPEVDFKNVWVPFESYLNLFDVAAQYIDTQADGSYHPVVTIDSSTGTLWGMERWPAFHGNENCTHAAVTALHLIRAVHPAAKILIILRNPVESLYSHFLFDQRNVNRNGSSEEFHRRVVNGIEHLQSCLETRSIEDCMYDTCLYRNDIPGMMYLRAGIYHVFIRASFDVFPKDQVKVVLFERYAADRLTVLDEIVDFLGLQPYPAEIRPLIQKSDIANSKSESQNKMNMFNRTRQLLQQFYSPHNQALADLLGDPRFSWTTDADVSTGT